MDRLLRKMTTTDKLESYLTGFCLVEPGSII